MDRIASVGHLAGCGEDRPFELQRCRSRKQRKLAGQSPPEGNDKCLEHAESWPSSVTSVRAGACHDATALPCCGHRFNVPDIGPPLDHLHAQPDAATDSCKQLATRPTRASVYRQPFKRRDGKRVMPSSIENFYRQVYRQKFLLHRQANCMLRTFNQLIQNVFVIRCTAVDHAQPIINASL
ncbi:MAG: hypothetical protein H6951_00020 [Zoogloeaceae bacterium]|nr:hypothetical protein [Zoogloeaceae bacterium]